MPHVYSITDGSTTITLSQASGNMPHGTSGFTLDAPDLDMTEVGTEVTDIEYRNVTQTIELLFIGASTSALQALVSAIDNMLYKAHRRQNTKVGPRVYLQLQIDGEANTWRTEILSGRLRMGDEALFQWIGKKVEAQLIVTRRFYWQGPEKELQLSANGQGAATGGRSIDNASNNWVQIAADQIGGVLPTPVKLVLTNNSGGSVGYRNLYLATNAYSDPANFSHTIAGGAYSSYSFTNTGSTQWTLASSLLQDTQGRWFRLLVRFTSWTGADIYIKPTLRDGNGLITLWEGDEVKLGVSGSYFVDLGAIPLPPGGYQTAWGQMVLFWYVRATGGATIQIDRIQLTPLDSYRWIVQRGLLIVNGGAITDDNIEGITHAGGSPIFSPKTDSLYVFPGVLQRIYVLQDTGSASSTGTSFSVRAYVRERRLTV